MYRRFSKLLGLILFSACLVGWNIATIRAADGITPKGLLPDVGVGARLTPTRGCVLQFGSCYYYAAATQTLNTQGAGATFSIEKPFVDKIATVGHSLAEVAVRSSNGQQIVEVGWIVDPDLALRQNPFDLHPEYPHLFTYFWVNGKGQGYNHKTKFIRNKASPIQVGDAWPTTTPPVHMEIIFKKNEWAIWVNKNKVGAYPSSLWNGNFTKVDLAQWFGEVGSLDTSNPMTWMGNGGLPTQSNAATITAMYYKGTDGVARAASPRFYTIGSPNWYDLRSSGNSMKYGGPGVPVITSVSRIGEGGTQRIVILGTGFGTKAAYNGDSPYIHIQNITRNWNAGWTGNSPIDAVTLNVTKWIDTEINLGGYTGAFGQSGWINTTGDNLNVRVWSPQTGVGPGECPVVVGAGKTVC